MYMEAPGTQAKADELIVPKARALANYIKTGKHPYATLVEIRRDAASGVETVVFDLVVELSQTRVHEVLDRERIAASFDPTDDTFPEVISLRDDFPWVPHLNHRDVEIPRSLCLYELPYTTVRLRWTPTVLVERIREWLSLTSEGKLHQDDQPLENVFLGQFPPLIYPSNFLKSIMMDGGNDGNAAIHFGVFAVGGGPESITGFVVADPRMQHVAMRPDHVATAVIAPARKHGLIRKTPQNLQQIIDVMQDVDIDLLSILRQRLRNWQQNDANAVGARILLLLVFPKYREEGSPPETWELDISGFLLLDPLREAGAKLGLWQVMSDGTLAMLIGCGDDHSVDMAVQIVNPVKQLTKARAALFNGTQPNDQKMVMVGVGALGSLTFQNLVRKGFGTWSIVDDDLLMPHNVARHALTALAAGAPKVTGMKQMIETVYEEAVVTSTSRLNILRPGTGEVGLAKIFGEADATFDCSADVPAARWIALDCTSGARRLSLFLSPDGEQMVLLAEDKDRDIKLDALECSFIGCCLRLPLSRDITHPWAPRFATVDHAVTFLRYSQQTRFHPSPASGAK